MSVSGDSTTIDGSPPSTGDKRRHGERYDRVSPQTSVLFKMFPLLSVKQPLPCTFPNNFQKLGVLPRDVGY